MINYTLRHFGSKQFDDTTDSTRCDHLVLAMSSQSLELDADPCLSQEFHNSAGGEKRELTFDDTLVPPSRKEGDMTVFTVLADQPITILPKRLKTDPAENPSTEKTEDADKTCSQSSQVVNAPDTQQIESDDEDVEANSQDKTNDSQNAEVDMSQSQGCSG